MGIHQMAQQVANVAEKKTASGAQTAEQIGLATLGGLGMSLPSLIEMGDIFSAITVIFSFFFIVLPTGVWACVRAYISIKKLLRGEHEHRN